MSPLTGVRVIDLSQWAQGGEASLMLADLGADVIKVEDPVKGDPMRGSGSYEEGDGDIFPCFGRNKRSLAVSLRTEVGQEIVRRLVDQSDVLITSFRPGVMERLSIGYQVLSERNPRLIYASCTAFGEEGPYQRRGGHDTIAQAMGGLMAITGEPGGPPTKVGGGVAPISAGRLAAIGILAALFERERTGLGRKVETSLFDAVVSLLRGRDVEYFRYGRTPPRLGTIHPQFAPNQAFPTQDGHIVIAVSTDAAWQKLCAVLGVEGLGSELRFQTNPQRLRNRVPLEDILTARFRERTTADWIAHLGEVVPCGPVNDFETLFTDEQVRANNLVVSASAPNLGPYSCVGMPVRLWRREANGEIREPFVTTNPPTLGQHSDEILATLGFDQEEIMDLREKGVIR